MTWRVQPGAVRLSFPDALRGNVCRLPQYVCGSSRRHRCSRRSAAIVLRAERTGIYALAARADRALRTLAARRCAASAYALARRLTATVATKPMRPERVLLEILAARPAWTRLVGQQFSCSFGSRRAVLTVPDPTSAEQLASMIARIEVKVLLGDSDPALVSHLQTFAARELQRLFTARRV